MKSRTPVIKKVGTSNTIKHTHMKIKNLILGTVATVFAVGGAFAANTFIIAKYAQTPGVCRAVNDIECGIVGAQVCRVVVTTPTGPQTYPLYQSRASAAVCSQPLTTVTTNPFPGEFIE